MVELEVVRFIWFFDRDYFPVRAGCLRRVVVGASRVRLMDHLDNSTDLLLELRTDAHFSLQQFLDERILAAALLSL